MTVSELRAILADMPDDAEIITTYDGRSAHGGEPVIELVRNVEGHPDEDLIWLATGRPGPVVVFDIDN